MESSVVTTETTTVVPETKAKKSFLGSFFGTIMKLLIALVKAISFAFISVFKAFKEVFSRLDAKSLASFLFLVVVLIATAYFIGFRMGEKSKENKIYDELGLSEDQIKEFREFLEDVQ